MQKINKQFNYFKKQPRSLRQAGFTLIEVMVSLMLFLIVVLAAIGSLYSVNNASRKVQAMRGVLDNLTFGIESMSRTIRTGNSIVCGGISNIGAPNCPFKNQVPGDKLLVSSTLGVIPLGSSQLVEYQLFRTNGMGVIQKRTQESGIWTNWIDLTAPEIDVQDLSFYVDGADLTDLIQPNVQVLIRGVATAGGESSPFAIQTYISERTPE